MTTSMNIAKTPMEGELALILAILGRPDRDSFDKKICFPSPDEALAYLASGKDFEGEEMTLEQLVGSKEEATLPENVSYWNARFKEVA